MEIRMEGLGSCPVCFLDLRPEIPLSVHLDTHPKDMIVNALMSWMSKGNAATAVAATTTATNMVMPTYRPVQQQQQQQQQQHHQTNVQYNYASSSGTTTMLPCVRTTMLQRNVQQVVDYRSGRAIMRDQSQNEFIQSGYYYEQQPEQILPPDQHEPQPHYVQASYMQDEEGNMILCTTEPPPTKILVQLRESKVAAGHGILVEQTNATVQQENQNSSQPSPPPQSSMIGFEYTETETHVQQHQPMTPVADPPEYAAAIEEKQKQKQMQNEQQKKGQTPAKALPKILSVSVLGPDDWRRNVEQRDENRVSPNAVLPTPLKKNISLSSAMKMVVIDAVPSTSSAAEPAPVRPVATSVIKTLPETIKLEIVEDDKQNVTPTSIAVEEDKKDLQLITPAPSTSTVVPQPIRLRKENRIAKSPKILKVTFKKPIIVESQVGGDNEPQPSTSRHASIEGNCRSNNDVNASQPISVKVEQHQESLSSTSCSRNDSSSVEVECFSDLNSSGEGNVKEDEEKKEKCSLTVGMEPGMLQLKAEACEEVFISQHSLIKMENECEEMEDEEGVGYEFTDMNSSDVMVMKESLDDDDEEDGDEDDEMGEGPSLKLYMNLKSEHDGPSIIEELGFSESSVSVCSMVNGVMERMKVNIRAEEVMPAKGEISEQESNADSELLWPSNTLETFETSRILPSYDTSVARESWNFGHANSSDNLTFNCIPKLSTMIGGVDEGQIIKSESFECDEAIAGTSDEIYIVSRLQSQSASSEGGTSFADASSTLGGGGSSSSVKPVARKSYSCPGCPETFRLFSQRKEHIIAYHEELLSKKQRYNYKKCLKKFAADGVDAGGGESFTDFSLQATGEETGFKRRIEQLSIIKLHRFLIEFNLKALKETVFGQREEFKGLQIEFSQRRVYFCTDCKLQFTTMREYRKHMLVHPVKCHTCELDATNKAAAITTIKQEQGSVIKTEAGEEVVAGDRGVKEETVFWSWRRFVEHVKMHLGLREVYTCKTCAKSFGSRRKLSLHMSVHTRKAYNCTFCPRTFMHFFRMKEHKKRHHFNKVTPAVGGGGLLLGSGIGGSKQKDYLCPCGEVFHSAAKFAWHTETHDKLPKNCPFCRERFVHKNSLSRHIRLAHQDRYADYKKDTLPCPVCNNRYIRTSLKTHLSSHMKRPEFQCSICSKILSTKWNLKMHRWTHNSRSQMPFKCAICPKAFMRSNDLQTHLNTHKAIRPFTCDHCGCQFSRKYNWVRHTREHETEKKFVCIHCDKTFHRAYYLKEHMRSHTNERPFECTICGKTSTTKTNHNKHLKIHHARDVAATEG